MRQFTFDVFTRADKVLCVIVVLFNASCDREDVRVEDDIFSREANLFGEDFVRPTANLDFRARVSAWPCSSKAITTTAAP